ncbi:hypothetical protein QJS10_CPA05g02418 [Acorus calamus]|uniref:Homeobox domain-containing protein n=1 Tax=Acorus calamus TaxID=4465 RepID=A0AAV9EVM3_ACOCL|nr:hypothetical protein QJS10_CPA05g02418 [Acorus calamus]
MLTRLTSDLQHFRCSREKIKPEKELQRARKQILKCKLGIRDAIHQLDLLSSEGCIENSVMQPDGSVFHEHDIFKEAANYSDEENTCLDAAEEWPSEDSQDDDYDPERNEETRNGAGTEGDASDESACSSSFYWSSGEGSPRVKFTNRNPGNANLFDSMTSINFEDTSDVEIMNCRRRRKDVDYKKLHDKLRQAFEENELPPKTVKEDLSKQLGLDFEKVSKWFKNARYVALKIRKERKDQIKCNNITNNAASEAMSLFEPLATFIKIPKRLGRLHGKNNPKMVQHKRKSLLPLEAIKKKLRTVMVNKNKSSSKFVKQNFVKQWRLSSKDQVSSQGDNAMSMKKRISRLRRSITSERETTEFDFEDGGQHYLVEMERLFCLENKIQRLKAKLEEYRDGSPIGTENDVGELHVMYVPVAEVKEKAQIF